MSETMSETLLSDTFSLSRPLSVQLSATARAVSDVLSPAALAIPCLALGVWASDVPGTYRFALLYFALAIPLPVAYVVWLLMSGRVNDFHLPNRRDRTGPFLVSIGCALAAAIALAYFQAPAIFMAPVITALAQTLVLFLVTLVWQISIHTATTTGLVTFAILALGSAAVVLAPLVPLVMWARIYLGRHTLTQTIAGAILGCLAFTTMFALRGIAW